ncbi:DUF134 domain-containing protein [Caldicellulosiruptoraceae bacterium PP1]
MPRPTRCRRVEHMPKFSHFSPEQGTGQEVIIKVEELEAIRLKDLEGLMHEDCAKKMLVSRQTFQLILEEARKKIADALINGKDIRVYGGNYVFGDCQYICHNCHKIFESDKGNLCPECNSNDISCLKGKGRGHCFRKGRL